MFLVSDRNYCKAAALNTRQRGKTNGAKEGRRGRKRDMEGVCTLPSRLTENSHKSLGVTLLPRSIPLPDPPRVVSNTIIATNTPTLDRMVNA